eukprot:Tamp_13759.p1 GENE.Tamp_13759~~Tamp_13759.p1  ORF type:complete len:489 (+),score=165.18 Tamp_13759:80-1468(+)
MGGVALLAAVVLASCVVALSGTGSPTALQQGVKVDWQALLAANPGMTPQEAQQQAQLMEEGSITIDPDSENPAADFYANSDADIGDNDDVEDAGPGNHLGGWTHPELLDPPSAEEVASFVDPANNLAPPVLNPVDYARNPGAAMAMSSARKDIKRIQADLAKTHEAAETAKATYEAEEAKSSKLKTEYQQYQQQMQAMMRGQRARANMAGNHNWSPDMDTAARSSGNLMWSQNAKAPEHKNNDADPNHWKIDTENMEDPAAEFRNNFYNRQQEEQAFLARQMQERAMQRQQSGRMQQEGSPMQQGMMYQQPRPQQAGAMRTVEGQQLRMLDEPQEEFGAARAGLEERNSRIAKEAYMLRENRQLEQLQRDTARLALARSRLARASRVQRVFNGDKFTEGCPEGTPGCGSGARYARGRQGDAAAALSHELNEERMMARMGDTMVPIDKARHQKPRFLGDALYQ